MLWVSSLLHPVAAAKSTSKRPAKVNREALYARSTEQTWGMWEKGREEDLLPLFTGLDVGLHSAPEV